MADAVPFEVPHGNEFRPEALGGDGDGDPHDAFFRRPHPLHEAHANGRPVPRKPAKPMLPREELRQIANLHRRGKGLAPLASPARPRVRRARSSLTGSCSGAVDRKARAAPSSAESRADAAAAP